MALGLGFWAYSAYLDPKNSKFLGFLIMISFCSSFKGRLVAATVRLTISFELWVPVFALVCGCLSAGLAARQADAMTGLGFRV